MGKPKASLNKTPNNSQSKKSLNLLRKRLISKNLKIKQGEKFNVKIGRKNKDQDSSKPEVTSHCDICGKSFIGRCGQSNMERHKRNIHRQEVKEKEIPVEEDNMEMEMSDLDLVTDFYNKIILKLVQ